ncbi:hypothetical protein BKA62DRAFT_683347 [Auriculariales sp. MPI-PUGE-AT-0066]|nr:hypothetical protein BKA62DRAFT_683347 [Auriculariales sp. MPI-PUGE-AT-0066]
MRWYRGCSERCCERALAKARLQLKPLASGATSVTSKQHPNVAKFAPGGDRVVAPKDKNNAFPVGQPLGVLKWRYADKDESVIPLSGNVWPTLNVADSIAYVSVEVRARGGASDAVRFCAEHSAAGGCESNECVGRGHRSAQRGDWRARV